MWLLMVLVLGANGRPAIFPAYESQRPCEEAAETLKSLDEKVIAWCDEAQSDKQGEVDGG